MLFSNLAFNQDWGMWHEVTLNLISPERSGSKIDLLMNETCCWIKQRLKHRCIELRARIEMYVCPTLSSTNTVFVWSPSQESKKPTLTAAYKSWPNSVWASSTDLWSRLLFSRLNPNVRTSPPLQTRELCDRVHGKSASAECCPKPHFTQSTTTLKRTFCRPPESPLGVQTFHCNMDVTL